MSQTSTNSTTRSTLPNSLDEGTKTLINPTCSSSETHQPDGGGNDHVELHCSSPARDPCRPQDVIQMEIPKEPMISNESLEVCLHEKLQRQRNDIAGRVWIPDTWGQEELMKDWIDSTSFNSSLIPNGIMSARAALVRGFRRTNSSEIELKNRS